MQSTGITVERLLGRGQVMDAAPDAGEAWRVERGLLLVHSPGSWRLALPGDWLNIEALCGLPPDTRITALVPSRLQALPALPAPGGPELLALLVRQQRRWTDHLLALRSGSVEQRIRHLLDLVRQAVGGSRSGAAEPDLPALRDIAALVDAAPETACRVLARLRPARKSPRPASGTARPLLACA